MRRWFIALAAIACLFGIGRVFADVSYTQGSGTTIFDFICFVSKHCSAHVPINSSGTEIMTAAAPAQVSLANTGANSTPVKVDNSAVTQPVSGTLTANQGTANATPWNFNAAQLGGFAINLGAGTVGTGTQRITQASDSPEIAALGTPADTAWVSGSGTLESIAKTIANNTGSAVPAGTARIGYVSDDPCTQLTKTNLAIATASGTTQLVVPSGSTQVYVCSFSLIAASTAVVNLVGGTGATCTTGTPVAALGSTTAASGASLAANGGLTFGNGGASVLRTTTAGHGLCLIQSGTAALAGNITYVQQ